MKDSVNNTPPILSKLEKISKLGVGLYLDGKMATPDEIAFHCVNETSSTYLYMPDYIMDETGTLTEIRYDKVVYR
jgi:hypothetical protein